MPKPHPHGHLSTSRPAQALSALTSAQSHAARGARSCLQLAAPPDETARRRSRVEELLAAGRLTIGCERDDLTHTVTLFSELDLATAAGLEVELMAVEATDAQQIVLDLSGLTFMDSGAVHLIARADARCRPPRSGYACCAARRTANASSRSPAPTRCPLTHDCVASRLRARRSWRAHLGITAP